jgi:hypothetical protein
MPSGKYHPALAVSNGDAMPALLLQIIESRETTVHVRTEVAFSSRQADLYRAFTTSPATPTSDQAWYWTPEWQARERDAEADLRAGRYEDFDSLDDFLASL